MNTVRIKYRLVLGFLAFLSILRSYATDGPPITYLGIEQGLSNNAVRCIFQDHYGFMWFGTYEGLNRYDGYNFSVFRNKFNDTSSLVNNWITTIAEDKNFNLWVGTRQGISLYNHLSSRLQAVRYFSYKSQAAQKLSVNIFAIVTDSTGNLFIGTEGNGLLFCRKGETRPSQLAFADKYGTSVSYSVPAIKPDNRGGAWVFIRDKGICLFDSRSGKFILVNDAIKDASCMEFDTEDRLWIGTTNGLYLYDTRRNLFTRHFTEAPGQLSDNRVVHLYKDRSGKLWVATDGGGITIMDTQRFTTDYLLPGNGNNHLTSEAVYSVYEDKQGRKWIGTLRGGINIIDPNKNRFQTIVHDPLNPSGLIGNFILSFCETSDGNLWIGTDGSGLSVWDRKKQVFSNYRRDPSVANSLSNNFVTSIKEDVQKQVWIATYGGGVNRYDKTSKSFIHYPCISAADGMENKNIWLLYQDSDKQLWAGCVEGKLYRLNRQEDRFEVFDPALSTILAMTEDHSGNLWAGDFNHLIRIDKKNRKHTFYSIGKPVRSIYEDRTGNFWIGTEGGGLLLFDRAKGSFIRYTEAEGLCNNSILNILEDEQGALWLSTFNGISKRNASGKGFKNFYQNDGLQSNQFNYNAALKLRTGELVFGGIKGFNVFYPSMIGKANSNPTIWLTGLRVNNQPIDRDDPYVKQTSADQVEAIRVPYNKAVLSFDFAALEYSAADKISYAYFLEGWDKTWTYTGSFRTANYSNLTEGNYTLWIRSTGADGNWSARQVGLKITVLPPWFRTWWAYLLYLLVAGGMVYLYTYYKARQNRLQYELKLVQVNAEKEREINEKRLSFFTNISHEFRTPLTLIINPVRDLLRKKDKTEEGHELNIVYRNARRLLSLIEQLLIFRRADIEADNMKFTRQNFYNLCNEVYLCFVQQAKTNRQEYIFRCDNKELELFVDRQKMEIALFNLLSNAIKFTPEGGSIIFSVCEKEVEVEVTVADSGYGIPREAASRLFEKFYQARSANAPVKSGFGIGLYLVRHFVEGHKGAISFTSREGEGTSFLMKLKKGSAHLDQQAILHQPDEEPVFLEELEEEAVPVPDENKLGELVSDRQTILVVDDDHAIRQYILQFLKDKYQILEADNGNEALKLANRKFPDLVISDIRMEGMDGLELCRSIKKDPSLNHIPVILLTGSFASGTELESLEGGADAYITKPFDKDILLARIENIFKSRSELQQYFFNEITLKKNTLKISSEYKDFLEKCIVIVEAHLEDDQFTIKRLSQEIGMSHSNLYKKVKSISGQSVNSFIRFIRLRKAAEILILTDCNVNQAAFQVGINDIKYFRVQFNKLFGMNPSEYIKKYRKSFDKSYHLSSDAVKEKPGK